MMGMQDPRAEDDFRRSLTLYEELLAESPRDPELRRGDQRRPDEPGLVLDVHRADEPGGAGPSAGRRSIEEALAAEFPDDPANLEQLTDHRIQIAAWMETSGCGPRRSENGVNSSRSTRRWRPMQPGRRAALKTAAASYRRLARALADVGRRREQQEALRRGLKLAAENPALLNDLAWSLALRPDAPPRESAEAIELAKRALAANPNDRATLATRSGWPTCEPANGRSPPRPSRSQWNRHPREATPPSSS